ncbi:hypothetical protein SAM19_05279 [Brevibacillus laterosporus]|nr:hypothetical protein [Brevibacillus laterosporus]
MFEPLSKQRAELAKLIDCHTEWDGTRETTIPSLFFFLPLHEYYWT